MNMWMNNDFDFFSSRAIVSIKNSLSFSRLISFGTGFHYLNKRKHKRTGNDRFDILQLDENLEKQTTVKLIESE